MAEMQPAVLAAAPKTGGGDLNGRWSVEKGSLLVRTSVIRNGRPWLYGSSGKLAYTKPMIKSTDQISDNLFHYHDCHMVFAFFLHFGLAKEQKFEKAEMPTY